jgi:MFS family permease
MMLSAATTNNYVLEYMTTYASSTLGMPAAISFGATAAIGGSGLICDTLGGWLSDRFGRKRVMIIPWLAMIVAIYPSFWLLERLRTGTVLLAVSALLNGIQTLSSATIIVAITESLPKRVRSGAFALIYALAISVFGGSTQFLVAWIIHTTGNPLAPAWYMLGAVAVGLIAMLRLPETAPVKQPVRSG